MCIYACQIFSYYELQSIFSLITSYLQIKVIVELLHDALEDSFFCELFDLLMDDIIIALQVQAQSFKFEFIQVAVRA